MSLRQVTLEEGLLCGVPCDGYTVFKGVPYAAPPVGALRFLPPQPVQPWTGVYEANRFAAACPQLPQEPDSFYEKEFYSTPERRPRLDEDCLYLNIWTPAADSQASLPVALWIHGGAFEHGFGHEVEFDGEAFCRRGVILVTINYRVNIFGFFSHPWMAENADNLGIRDQIAALNWVREHIRAFGGDPDSITVFGQSAGAISTQTLVSSPLTAGMISKAIFQSAGGYGTGLGAQCKEDAEAFGIAFAESVGARSLDDLRAIPAAALMQKAMAFAGASGTPLPFAPVCGTPVLPASYDALAERGQVADIPYLLGATRNDILATGSSNPIQSGCIAWSQLMDRLGRGPSYVYAFNRALPGDDAGAFHSSELWYLFGTLRRCWRPFTPEDEALSARMTDAWVHFIKDGTPDDDGHWQPCSAAAPYVQIFDTECS